MSFVTLNAIGAFALLFHNSLYYKGLSEKLSRKITACGINRNNLAYFVIWAIGLLLCLPGQLQGQVMGNFSVRGVTNFQVSASRQTSMMATFDRYSTGASNLTAGMPRSSPNPFSVHLRQSMTGPVSGPSIGAAAKGSLRNGTTGMMDKMKMPNNFSNLFGSVPTAAASSPSTMRLLSSRVIPSFRPRSSRTNAFTIRADELGKPFLPSRRNSLTTGLTSRKSRLSKNRLSRSRLTGLTATELTQGLTRSLTHPTTLYDARSNLLSNNSRNRTRSSLSQKRIGLNRLSNKRQTQPISLLNSANPLFK